MSWREFTFGFDHFERGEMHMTQIRNLIARRCRIGRVVWK